MKKIIIIAIILIVILVGGISFWLYKVDQENKRIDAEAVTFKEDMTIEFGKKAKVSDFLENLNGTLIEDKEIDTEKLGEIKVSFDFMNIKNKKRTREFTIKTIDVTSPQIFSGSSYTVKVGYNKNLTDVLLSADDIDDNPKREILGDYDMNTDGTYNLTYSVTDSSGNQTKKDFTLYVKEKIESNTSKPEPLYLADVLEKYKTDKTKIGIDVSKWQGEINWQEVKDDGIEFVMIRMGYQTDYDGEYVIDPYFVSNIQGAKAVRITSGAIFLFIC